MFSKHINCLEKDCANVLFTDINYYLYQLLLLLLLLISLKKLFSQSILYIIPFSFQIIMKKGHFISIEKNPSIKRYHIRKKIPLKNGSFQIIMTIIIIILK